MPVNFTPALIDQIIKGRCADFAAVMGMRKTKSGELQVNVFLPGATAVEVLQRNGKKVLCELMPLHPEGLFSGTMTGKKVVPYKLRVQYGDASVIQDDPYRFSCRLDKGEMQLFAQGQHDAAWQLLGARRCSHDDVDGVQFVLWAPAAQRVSLLCDLNGWDGRRHVMRRHAAVGLWELFIPGFASQDENAGAGYKFEILTGDQQYHSLPFDPFARRVSKHPVFCTHLESGAGYRWLDSFWQQVGKDFSGPGRPITIREVAVATSGGDSPLNWQQLVPLLLEETRADGFTHLLLTARSALAVSDQRTVCGLLAPDPTLGSPDDLRRFIDQAHELELGVLWDVPLLSVLYSLGSGRDPLALLEPEALDGPLLSILLGYFSYWRESFHIDGFRVRDVDWLLQLEPSGTPDETGRKNARNPSNGGNPFVREWVGQLLQKLRMLHPGLLMMVETAQPDQGFAQPSHRGGPGFDYQMLPSESSNLRQAGLDARLMTRQLLLALQDGNRDQRLLSLPWQRMVTCDPDDAGLQQSWLALVMLALWTLPGRKHVQLDCLLKQGSGWNPDAGHDWELQHTSDWSVSTRGWLRELNQLYQSSPCLYEVDASHEGISLLHDDGEGLFAFERRGRQGNDALLIVLNAGSDPATAEIIATNAGLYQLRCHTPVREGQDSVFPKVVQNVPSAASTLAGSRGQKLVLNLPACSGAVYAWQG